jgi:hypothetical protein
MARIAHVLSFASFIVLAALAACASSSDNGQPQGPTCDQNPAQCPAGQTCWPNANASALTCIPSGAGRIGDACQNTEEQATCSDGLFCLQSTDPGSTGTCTPFCDPTKPACPGGGTCRQAQLVRPGAGGGPIINICVGVMIDAGAPADAAPSDASSSADASSTDATGE